MTTKTPYGEMVEAYDRLDYMIRTTAPHLQGLSNELKAKIKAAFNAPPGVPPPSAPPPVMGPVTQNPFFKPPKV